MRDEFTNEQTRKKAEHIRRQYLAPEDNTLAQLERLDSKVKTPGIVAATLLGVVGALVMGSGMSFVMVWGNMAVGLALGLPGLLALTLVYPLYALVTARRKKTYAPEILQLSKAFLRHGAE